MNKVLNMVGALVLAFVMPLSALAEGIPAIPVYFHGNVKINGNVAPVGTVVAAESGSKVIDSYTLEVAGKYFMDISEDDVALGSTIYFKINGKDAGQTNMVKINQKSSVVLDLAITTSTSTGNTGGPSGGNVVTIGTSVNPTGSEDVTPITPAVSEPLASDENGQVLAGTDISVIDGDIIQCKDSANPFAVYIVKEINGKKYIRHIVSLEIFNHYKHLKWENLIQVESLDGYLLSGWVRVNTGANGNPGASDRVFEINGDQSRHWIDMTAGEFLLHGGSDEAIYSVNAGELSLYREGPAVKLQ